VSVDLNIVVVTYNSADVIVPLLDSIREAAGQLTVQVVVVDNGSTDGTAKRLRDREDVTLVPSTNTGYAAGLNLGVQRAEASGLLLLLNPDTRLKQGSIPPLVETAGIPGTGVVAPMVRDTGGVLQHSLRREPTLLRAIGLNWTGIPLFSEYLNRPSDYRTPRVVDWALGAALLLTRECYDAVGGLDESFFLYSEETDFCLRARELGYLTRFEPRSEVVHVGGGSGRDDRTHTMQVLNRVRLYARRHPRPLAYVYMAANLASEMSWIVRGHRPSRASVRALLSPGRRPAVLRLGTGLLPTEERLGSTGHQVSVTGCPRE